MKVYSNAGAILKNARGPMPRKTLAAATNYDVSYIAGVESGKKDGSPKFFEKCASALKVPVSRFITDHLVEAPPLAEDDFDQFIKSLSATPVIPPERGYAGRDLDALQAQPAIEECEDAVMLASRLEMLLAKEAQRGADGRATALWTARHYAQDGAVYRALHKNALPRFLQCDGHFTHVWRNGKDKNGSTEKNIDNQVATVLEMLKCAIRYSNYDNYRCVLCPHMIIRAIPTDLYLTKHSGFIITLAGWLEAEPEKGLYSTGPNGITSKYGEFLDKNAYPVVTYFRTNQARDFYLNNARAEGYHRDRIMVQRLFATVLRPIGDFEQGRPWWSRTDARSVHREFIPVDELARLRRESVQEFDKSIQRNTVKHVASYEALRQWAATGIRNDIVLMGTDERGRFEKKEERMERLRHIQSLLDAYEKLEISLVDEPVFATFMGSVPKKTGYEVSWVVHGTDAVVLEVADTCDPEQEKLWRILINDSESADVFIKKFNLSWDRLPASDKDRKNTQKKVAELLRVAEESVR
jgi:transcriptional regulator with XRE-family HTH domain